MPSASYPFLAYSLIYIYIYERELREGKANEARATHYFSNIYIYIFERNLGGDKGRHGRKGKFPDFKGLADAVYSHG